MLKKDNPEVPRLSAADGIRGLACFTVLITHAISMFFVGLAPYLSGTGKIGVWLFFVLSAFLLTHKFQKTGFGLQAVFEYAIGRILRIIPLFTIAIIVYKYWGTAGIDTWHMVRNAILFQQGFAHLWTIPVEFKFYFILPVFAFFASKIKAWLGLSGFFVFFLLLALLHQTVWPYWSTDINSIELRWYLPIFFAGVILSYMWEDIQKKLRVWIKTILSFAVIFSLVLLSPGARNFLFSAPLDYWLADKFLLISGLWVIFIVCTIKGEGFFGRLMKSKFLTWLGTWSYSIYLFHWFVYSKFIQYYPNNLFAMLGAIFLSVVSGALIFKFVEQPIENFRHKIKFRALAVTK